MLKDEDPLESDQDSTDEPDVIDCPHCGRPMSELAEVCSKCGSYISQVDAPQPKKPRLYVLTAVVLMVMLALGYVCLN